MKTMCDKQGLVVDNEVITIANLGDQISLSASDHLIMLSKSKMTATDIVKTIESMTDEVEDLLKILAQACKTCNTQKFNGDKDTTNIKLPGYILEVAGIPQNAKLTAYAEEDSGIVRVEQADYNFDITNVSEKLIMLFSEYGICMKQLDTLLIRGNIING